MTTRTAPSQGIFSASAISSFESCEMKAHLQYDEGWENKNISNSLKTGIIMHDMQEMYLLGHNETAVINSIEEDIKSRGWDSDPLFLPKIRAYIKGYYHRWEAEDAYAFTNGTYEVLSIEEVFTFKYVDESTGNFCTYVGRTDAVLRDIETDCIVLMEHKNVSTRDCQDPASIFWQSLIMNNQLTIYASYLEEKYDKPVYVWYDVMQTSPASKPKLVKKVRETLEEFEERLTLTYQSRDENKYIRKKIHVLGEPRKRRMEEIYDISKRAQSASYLGTHTRNTQSCRNYGGCEFFHVCVGTENIYESNRFKKKDHYIEKETDEQPF